MLPLLKIIAYFRDMSLFFHLNATRFVLCTSLKLFLNLKINIPDVIYTTRPCPARINGNINWVKRAAPADK